MTSTPKRPPHGLVAILIAPDGDVVATATDFHFDRYGGCDLIESQTMRVRNLLAINAIKTLCAEDIAKAITDFERDSIMRTLVRTGGYRIEIVPIGHGESEVPT